MNSPIKHFRQDELAARWSVSPRTLERWRWLGQGPRFVKIGGRVVYREADVVTYETERTRSSTVFDAKAAFGVTR